MPRKRYFAQREKGVNLNLVKKQQHSVIKKEASRQWFSSAVKKVSDMVALRLAMFGCNVMGAQTFSLRMDAARKAGLLSSELILSALGVGGYTLSKSLVIERRRFDLLNSIRELNEGIVHKDELSRAVKAASFAAQMSSDAHNVSSLSQLRTLIERENFSEGRLSPQNRSTLIKAFTHANLSYLTALGNIIGDERVAVYDELEARLMANVAKKVSVLKGSWYSPN